MKQNYQKPSIHVVEIEGCDIICTSTSTTSTTKNTNYSNNETKTEKPVSQPQVSSMGNLKTEERLAKNVVDAHFSGNDANFKYFSDMLAKDAAMEHDQFWGCKSYFILSQAFFYTLTKNFNPQSMNNMQRMVFYFTQFYLLKARREMEKGNIPYDTKQYITLCKQLCYVSSTYDELIFERVSGMLPNGTMETYAYQIMGLSYVNYLSIQDKGAHITVDDHTEMYYKSFIKNNQAIINGTLSSDRKAAFYNHVHGNEDTLLQTYEIEIIS